MKVVIVGGGFGGLAAARALKNAPVEVTLIDRRNFHLFQPLLYQVATGGLSPANVASPLRDVLRKQANVHVLLGEVNGFDVQGKRVLMTERAVDYDVLIVATGSQYNYYGHPEWAEDAPSLKTIEDATEIRGRILGAFEAAEAGAVDEGCLTFVVIGGGPTGVEMAGAIAELARTTLPGDFRRIKATDARILLLEADARILAPYPQSLAREAVASLGRLGVEVRVNARVVGVDGEGVTIATPGGEERISARTVIWAAGVVGTSVGEALAKATGMTLERSGRLRVTPQLNLPGHPDIYVIGDLAWLEQDGEPLPALAPVAMQQGAFVGRFLSAPPSDTQPPAFRYKDRGNMATIGRSAAIADLGFIRLHGFIGWVTWLTVHLMMIVQFQNRVLVFIQWAWNYFTYGRSARLITGSQARPRHPRGDDPA